MNRTIKFRGLRTDGKGWVYGDLLCNWTIHQILSEDDGNEYKVIPESVGQFTGLHDKNEMEIYEGDLLSCVYWEGENFVVKYEQDDRWIGYWFPKDDKDLIEIIGNIHTDTNSK